jgi:hypothetical protein
MIFESLFENFNTLSLTDGLKIKKTVPKCTKQFSGEWRKERKSIRLGSSSVTKKQHAKAWTGKIQSLEDQKEMQMSLSDWYFLLYQRNYTLWISSLKT